MYRKSFYLGSVNFINFIPINLLKWWSIGTFVSGRVTAFKREKL